MTTTKVDRELWTFPKRAVTMFDIAMAIRSYKMETGQTSADVAKAVGIALPSFNAYMSGQRSIGLENGRAMYQFFMSNDQKIAALLVTFMLDIKAPLPPERETA